MKPSYLLLLVVMNVFWAASLSIYKAMEQWLEPGGIVTMRFGGAALLMALAWPLLPGKAPRGKDLAKAAIMGLLVFTVGQRLQVHATKLGTAGVSSMLMGVEPLITSVAAALFLREHIGSRRWTGFALGMVGVALLNGILRANFKWADLAVSLLFISSFVGEAAYSVIGKPMLERAGPFKILAVGLMFGTAANLLIDGRETIAAAGAMPMRGWWMVIYLSTICSAIGYAIWFIAIRETDVNLVAMTIFVQPLAGVAIAAIWLNESLHWDMLWGGLAIVAGMVWGLSRQMKKVDSRNRPLGQEIDK